MSKCIVCDDKIKFDEVKSMDQTHTTSMINDAVVCTTIGNYGSAVLDLSVWPPSDQRDSWLEFYICDRCLILKKESFRLVTLVAYGRNKYTRGSWDPQ